MIRDNLAENSVNGMVFWRCGIDKIESAVQRFQRLMWVIAQIH